MAIELALPVLKLCIEMIKSTIVSPIHHTMLLIAAVPRQLKTAQLRCPRMFLSPSPRRICNVTSARQQVLLMLSLRWMVLKLQLALEDGLQILLIAIYITLVRLEVVILIEMVIERIHLTH